MDPRDRHVALDYGHLALHIAGVLLVIAVWVAVIWLIVSKPNAKLFEADGVVCYSQPLQMECLKVR
jgi:hypothetical protein